MSLSTVVVALNANRSAASTYVPHDPHMLPALENGRTMRIPATTQQPDTRTTAVAAADLTMVYGSGPAQVRALDCVTVAFPAAELTAIMGPSGSGKSTLLHVLAGLERPTTGTVWIGDTDVTALNDRALSRLRRTRVGFVFQSFNLVPSLSAHDNIVLPIRLDGRHPDPAWLATVIDTVGLGDRLDHLPSQLSGGQQQRVAIARALLTRPAVVFADEPTGNLDAAASGEVLVFLRASVDGHGQTTVMVTHDPHAAAHADRVLFLADGRIVDQIVAPTVTGVLDAMRTLGG